VGFHAPIETCQVLPGGSAHVSMLRQPEPLKHELCFNPMYSSFMLLHAIPIHNVLDLFQFSHASSNFRHIILLKQLMKVMK
jgi:hypothetical protein